MNNKNEMVEAVIAYAKKGLKVIPVHGVRSDGSCTCNNPDCRNIGKHPREKNWPQVATTNITTIEAWWEKYPDANVGIVPDSGLVVVDVDPRNGGDKSIVSVYKSINYKPVAPKVLTGGGGFHEYYKSTSPLIKNRTGAIPGGDIKTAGGFVVAPPSRHSSGNTYRHDPERSLLSCEIPEMPDALVNALFGSENKKVDHKNNSGVILEGARNDKLFRYACKMKRMGHEKKEAQWLVILKNESECKPPLEDDEIIRIVENVFKKSNSEIDFNDQAYLTKDNKTFRKVYDKNGDEKELLLANFSSKITREVTIDDGLEKRLFFTLSTTGQNGVELPIVETSSEKFSSMSWTGKLGARAIVSPGYMNRDYLRAAIQSLSDRFTTETIYAHTGWMKKDGKYYFLSASGGLSEDGLNDSIKVDLEESKLTNFFLPSPICGKDLAACLESSLLMLEAAPDEIGFPIFCSIYRAPLNEFLTIDFSTYAVGSTGVYKTEYCAIAQAHFGKFDARNLPESWNSTANTLERKTCVAKDCLFLIDDYVPGISSERDAERLLRSQGNKSGRGRMRPGGELRLTNFPRCLVMVTGEDVPRGQSLRPRLFIVEINKGDIDTGILTILQKNVINNTYPKVMSSYLQWCAGKAEKIKAEINGRFMENREKASTSAIHKRTPGIVSSLFLGFEYFTQFACEAGAVSSKESQQLLGRCWEALGKTAENQLIYQVSEDPVQRFIDLIQCTFIQGRAHLCDAKTNGAPDEAEFWGWKVRGLDQYPQGDRIGWLSNDEIWLYPEAVYASLQRLAFQQNSSIHITKESLWKRLAHEGVIVISEAEQKNLIKRTIPGGKRPRLLIVKDKNLLRPAYPDGVAPVAPVGSRAEPNVLSGEDRSELIKKHRSLSESNSDKGLH